MNIHELITKVISDHGQSSVAESIGESDSTLSRFRSGQGGMTIGAIQRLLDEYDMTITPKNHEQKLEDALEVITDLWKKARNS